MWPKRRRKRPREKRTKGESPKVIETNGTKVVRYQPSRTEAIRSIRN